MSCDYCKGAKRLATVNCHPTVTVDPVSEVIDVTIPVSGAFSTVSFAIIANYCPVCGADLHSVAKEVEHVAG